MRNLRAALVCVGCCLVAGLAWAQIDHGTLGVADTTTVTNILQVTDNPNRDEAQCWGSYPWSADGQQIVYTSEVDGSSSSDKEICVILANGTFWRRLTTNTTCDSHASFTPDGRIVFQRYDPASGDASIWIMNRDGSGQTDLTAAHGGPVNGNCENKPRVSPDGTMIAFHTCDEDLWVMDIDGGNPVEVAAITNSNKHEWSSDSNYVYFNCNTTGDQEIYRAAADGSELLGPLTDPLDGDCSNWPSPSPAGTWVAYHQDDQDGLGDGVTIRLMSPDGSSHSILVDGGANEVCGPTTWSPDGQWLAYKVNPGTGSREIYIINIGTLEVRQLTQGYYDYRQWWSPDGSRILFRDRGNNRDGNTLDNDLLVLNLADPSLFGGRLLQAGIPTLGSLGMVLLALLTAGAGVIFVRRWLA